MGQALAVLKLNLNFVGNRLPAELEELRKECRESVRYIDETIENVRRLSQDLSPSVLEELGLSAALRKLFHHFRNSFEVHVVRKVSDLDEFFSPQAQILIYRIFQEVFTNIMKHARARKVSVGMVKEGEEISCDIEDDGRGFDPDKDSETGTAIRGAWGYPPWRRGRACWKEFWKYRARKGKGREYDSASLCRRREVWDDPLSIDRG